MSMPVNPVKFTPMISHEMVEDPKKLLDETQQLLEPFEIQTKTYHETANLGDHAYLEKIFTQLKKHKDISKYSETSRQNLHSQLNNLLRMYASTFYNNNWATCRLLSLTALRLQICEFPHLAPTLNLVLPTGIEDILKFDTLNAWKASLTADPDQCKTIEKCLITKNTDGILNEVKQKLPKDQFIFASTLRWTIHCIQNQVNTFYNDKAIVQRFPELAGKPAITEEMFTNLFNMTKTILSNISHPEDLKEIAKIELESLSTTQDTLFLISKNQIMWKKFAMFTLRCSMN